MKPDGKKYTISVDFDGVLHSYASKWTKASEILDPPVPGAIAWLHHLLGSNLDVAVFSTRNHQWGGKKAMRKWLVEHFTLYFMTESAERFNRHEAETLAKSYVERIKFPLFKPPALVYVDDRAFRFEGDNWPTAQAVHQMRPWNRSRG